jgi:Dolichyl-phosphate-mannose-protein mannosyltransferase
VRQRAPVIAGAILGLITAAVYLVGSNRSFGYDAAATFSNFVATPNFWDAFAFHQALPTIPLKNVASNDHVLVSVISHLIYSLTGSHDEVVYRLAPALAAGATVGLTAAVVIRRFGWVAGVSAALFVAADPLFVDNSRDLRGYSLAALGCVIATLLLAGKRTRWRMVGYALAMGLAIAAQFFAGVVLLAHVVWIASRRSRSEMVELTPAWAGAAAMGIAANAYIQYVEIVQHGYPASLFNPTFPRDLVLFLLGAPVLIPIGLWLATAGLGLWVLRDRRWLWTTIAVLAAVVAVLWLVIQPAYLYPRFFVFLVPGIAYVMAAAIQRWKVLAPVVVAGAVIAAVSQAPGYTEDQLALHEAAATIDQVHATGGRACVLHADEQVLAGYTDEFSVVTSPDELSGCDAVVVVSWNVDLAVRDLAARQFPRARQLPASYPAVVLER